MMHCRIIVPHQSRRLRMQHMLRRSRGTLYRLLWMMHGMLLCRSRRSRRRSQLLMRVRRMRHVMLWRHDAASAAAVVAVVATAAVVTAQQVLTLHFAF